MSFSKSSSRFEFIFLDEATSSSLRCKVCSAVPKEPLKAQCCGAVYCQSCSESTNCNADSSPQINVCISCKYQHPTLTFDQTLKDITGALKVKCTYVGCNWVGEFANGENHMMELHSADLNTTNQQSWAERYRRVQTPAIRPTYSDQQGKSPVSTPMASTPHARDQMEQELQSETKRNSRLKCSDRRPSP